ncbi:MAG: carboxymuconolactone decarboxylase family protein [Acidimicrobiia bacterium]
MGKYQGVLDEVRGPAASLRHEASDAWAGFAALHSAAMADGEISARMKELVALAISVVKGCEGCVAHHARRAARLGATRSEVAEILSVALLMDGGPATVYGPRAWEAFIEFESGRAIPDVA